jgi:hypothetical protein
VPIGTDHVPSTKEEGVSIGTDHVSKLCPSTARNCMPMVTATRRYDGGLCGMTKS